MAPLGYITGIKTPSIKSRSSLIRIPCSPFTTPLSKDPTHESKDAILCSSLFYSTLHRDLFYSMTVGFIYHEQYETAGAKKAYVKPELGS